MTATKGKKMSKTVRAAFVAGWAMAAMATVNCFAGQAGPSAGTTPAPIDPRAMPRIGSVDERYQSYNIEMVEVTGGRFWRPYASKAAAPTPSGNQPAGMDPSLYEYRAPINLANPRLRKLAAALGPVYLRVSGTWANTTFFQDSDAPPPVDPPPGFKAVLTRAQWKGVVDFSRAVNGELVTSFSIGPGARDTDGVWTPSQARQILAYTKSVGGSIAAAEFMNEPNFATLGGAPKGYDAAAYGRDFHVFDAFARKDAPGMLVLGPGGVGEGTSLLPPGMQQLSSASLLAAEGPGIDVFSYHSYAGVSSRCGAAGQSAATTTADAALSDEWLARPAKIEEFYAALRDRFAPGKAIWLTETAQTACGGDRWASSFVDSFRYLNQLGLLARLGVKVHMHNTLAASDYGLLDEKSYEPRPNYWSALLWGRLMGTTVLDAGASSASTLHLYAHCLRDHPGGVALLAINADRSNAQSLQMRVASERYTLTAPDLMGKLVALNGTTLQLGADDALPALKGVKTGKGGVAFAPESITFLAMPEAHNASCQ
jgi:heparanase 1